MTHAASSVRALGALSAGLLSLGMLAACTPASEPEPEPTETALFASDEEAFRAAEETYEAYTAALNEVDTSNPDTFEPAFQWTAGAASTALRESLTELHAEEVALVGDTVIATSTPVSADLAEGVVSIHVCADVSDTDVLDAAGKSLVPDGRAPIQSMLVELRSGKTKTGLVVTSTTGDDKHTCSR